MEDEDIVKLVQLIREKLSPFVSVLTDYAADDKCVMARLTLVIKKPDELQHIIHQLDKI